MKCLYIESGSSAPPQEQKRRREQAEVAPPRQVQEKGENSGWSARALKQKPSAEESLRERWGRPAAENHRHRRTLRGGHERLWGGRL